MQATQPPERVLFDQREAAEYLGISIAHFKKLRPLLLVINLATPKARSQLWRWHRVDLEGLIRSGAPVS